MGRGILFALVACLMLGCETHGQNTGGGGGGDGGQWLEAVGTIALPAVEGRIDHFALDAKGKRLFMAALGNDTVEVIELATNKVSGRIEGLRTPQGVAAAADLNRVAVANDKDGSCRLFDATSLKQVGSVDLKDDADNVRYDAAARRFWVAYGDGGLAAIDAVTGNKTADVKLDGHPESFQLEAKGTRIFVNVPHAGQVAVVDRVAGTVVARWKLAEAEGNFPMALDEANHRLFVGCRRPAKLLVLDTQTGRTVAALDVVGDTDDLFYDAANRRVYVAGGAGAVTVVEQADADTYRVAGEVKTAAGARTSFFVAETGMLYVAAPRRGAQGAEVLVFKAQGK